MRKDEGDKALDRMFKKGGRAHFSLRRGSAVHPTGEKATILSTGMTDEEWEEHLKTLPGHRPDVIYL